ncbi:MAG TPA: hypothetical protein VHX67_09775 [Acidimicrobiales bacterium]|jgi:hypothetical protein|nr:hypothetical protein [Acidimicrobiales bacterium]
MHPLRQHTARTAATTSAAAAAAALTVATLATALGVAVATAAPAGAADGASTTTTTAATTTTTAAGSSAATAQYNAALKAVGRQGVHFSSVAKQNGAELDVFGDAGSTAGAQTLVVKNKNVTERMSALVVGSTGYVKGNEAALQHVIGLTTAESKKYANKWLSFPTSNQGLGELVGGLLSSQVSKELEIGGPYTYGKSATVGGVKATAIIGSVATESGSKVPVVLYIPASGKPLPIEEVTNAGGKSSSDIEGTVTFSHWGENKSQTAPTKTTSLLKLVPASSGSTTSG